MFKFQRPLEEGIVLSRPNRFIMMVRAANEVLRCHCPTTGRLGDAKVSSLPCLFSRSDGAGKTEGTVQAVSFDPPRKKRRSWVGINQNAANRYVQYFLERGELGAVASGTVRREVKLGRSRIDFLVGDTYLEVKTPLVMLPTGSAEKERRSKFVSFDRTIKHMTELSSVLKEGKKAVLLMCYFYDAAPFKPPARNKDNARILDAAARASRLGVERWQANFRVTKEGVALTSCFRNEVAPDRSDAGVTSRP